MIHDIKKRQAMQIEIIDKSISEATQKDIPTLTILVNSAFRGETSKKGWTTEDHLLAGIRTNEQLLAESMLEKGTTILKYVENGAILGMVMLKNQKDKLYLGMLTVSPDVQRGGIGKKLLYAAEDFAKKHNLPQIAITVISVRQELIDWYIRHGYRLTGETQPFPIDNPNFGLPKQFLEFVVMEKKMI
jgi:ribosomal protein S18 acetylase RimI-like enzyme